MEINFKKINIDIDTKKLKKGITKTTKVISKGIEALPKKAKTASVVAMFLLPTLGIVNKCTGSDPNKIVIIENPIDVEAQKEFVDKKDCTFHVVQKGDNIYNIGKKYGITQRRLLAVNNLTTKSIIHPNDTILIPESYTVKNVKTLDDVSKATGLSMDYLETLKDFEKVYFKAENDRNNNPTVGVGHLVTKDERAKYLGRELSNEEVYTLLAQDILDAELDIKTKVTPEAWDEMPISLKESVIDLAFNKGSGAITENLNIYESLNNKDYVTAIANLTQDYSIVKGEKKPASGLSKRRLYDISNATKIFKNGIPDKVLESAEEVYNRGLKYMEEEKNRKEISAQAYPNVLAEYKDLAYEWFDGKIGKPSDVEAKTTTSTSSETNEVKQNEVKQETVTSQAPVKASSSSSGTIAKMSTWSEYYDKMQHPVVAKNTIIKTPKNKFQKTWKAESLRNSCINSAKNEARDKYRDYCAQNGIKYNEKNLDLSAFDRIPYPVVDKNGNIIVDHTKILRPKKSNGKTVIINPGHGGYDCRKGTFDVGAYYFSKRANGKYAPVIEYEKMIQYGDEVAKKLLEAGYEVVLTSGGHLYTFNDNKSFQKIADNLINGKFDGKKRSAKNISFLSFHADKSSSKDIKGAGVCYDYRHSYDTGFAEIMANSLNEGAWITAKANERGRNKDGLQQLYQTDHIPSLLLEVDYLNGKNASNLESSDYRKQFIEQVVAGLNNYYNINK